MTITAAFNEARRALAAAHRTAVFSGAGLSAESGIATFRGNEPDSLWSQFNPLELASVDGFLDNTERSSSFGGEHIELLGAASVLLPELLDGLRVS